MSWIMRATIILFLNLLQLGCGGGGGDTGESSGSADNEIVVPPVTSVDTVATQCGSFRGRPDPGAVSFKGIPFAKPPIGSLRWQPPAPVDCETDVRPAQEFGAACAQFDADGNVLSVAEDCLYLNVWTPAEIFPTNLRRPVLFFIHGGGNQRGSPSHEQLGVSLYDGQRMAAVADAVVVTVGYRLGALGFLAHPALSGESVQQRSGNYGLLDQLAALQWVQDNIVAFGGDPQRVTIFGESGGARDVCSLVASPLASGLIQGAIMQSGGCRQQDLLAAEVEGQALAASIGCPSATDSSCLREASVQQLLDAVGVEVTDGAFVGRNIGPIVDEYVLQGSPDEVIAQGAHNPVPLIIGANTEETGVWARSNISEQQYEGLVRGQFGALLGDLILAQYPIEDYSSPAAAYVALSTDSQFICPARRVAQAAAVHSQPVYVYRFAKAFESTPLQGSGAFHGIELFYLFQKVSELQSYVASESDKKIEQAMADFWVGFAGSGNPNSAGEGLGVEWEPYSTDADTVLHIDSVTAQIIEPRLTQCEFWGGLGGG